jgi:hypothetical protein
MKSHRILPLIVISLLAWLSLSFVGWSGAGFLVAAASSTSAESAMMYQVAPTPTPELVDNEVILTTNPTLLQIMIFLGIVAVLVIFLGVWVNRRKLDMG